MKEQDIDHMIEELQATIQEKESQSRNFVIEANFLMGQVLYQLSGKLSPQEAKQALQRRLGRGSSALDQYKAFYKYVLDNHDGNLEAFMVSSEHSQSWNRIRKHVLYETTKKSGEIDHRASGETSAKRRIKKHGIGAAKEFIGGYSEAITDYNEENK